MRRRNEVIVGVFITVAVIVGIIGTMYLARRGFAKTYPVYALFQWGSGLKQGQPVLLAGVQVGYVDKVELRRTGYLYVTLGIEKQDQIPVGSTATVVPVGFFGDQAVALKPQKATMESIPAGDTIPAGVPSPSISDLMGRLDTLSRGITTITEALQTQLVDKGGLADLRQTISSAQQLIKQLNGTVAEQSRGLTATMATVRRTLGAIDSTSVDSTVRNFATASQHLTVLTSNLEHMTDSLNTTLAKLNSGQGTAGKLLTDPTLYMDLHDVIVQMDSLVSDIKKNPKRYINVSVF
jgi:phospholipid/cholesterol/gamma-HCH transport system substrate-binding protein